MDTNKARQTKAEQRLIHTMYAHLDAGLSGRFSAQGRATATPVEGTGVTL